MMPEAGLHWRLYDGERVVSRTDVAVVRGNLERLIQT